MCCAEFAAQSGLGREIARATKIEACSQEQIPQFKQAKSNAPGSTRIMTTEPTQPQSEQGPAPDNGQVQSHGHRRRRRRRKNKSNQQAGCKSSRRKGRVSRKCSRRRRLSLVRHRKTIIRFTRFTQARGGRRRSSSRRIPHHRCSPATALMPQQGRRKGRQKGPRTFVGPMDHSYRVANGNVADGPPSTIPTAGNGHGGSYYPDAYSTHCPRPSAKTLQHASSASLRICSSWPRFRRRRASLA